MSWFYSLDNSDLYMRWITHSYGAGSKQTCIQYWLSTSASYGLSKSPSSSKVLPSHKGFWIKYKPINWFYVPWPCIQTFCHGGRGGGFCGTYLREVISWEENRQLCSLFLNSGGFTAFLNSAEMIQMSNKEK